MRFEYELFMSKEFIEQECSSNYIDSWDVAQAYCNEFLGCEYNLCIEEGDNYSAIYKMQYNPSTDYYETDYSCYIHYEIDVTDPNWEFKFIEAMQNALVEFSKSVNE